MVNRMRQLTEYRLTARRNFIMTPVSCIIWMEYQLLENKREISWFYLIYYEPSCRSVNIFQINFWFIMSLKIIISYVKIWLLIYIINCNKIWKKLKISKYKLIFYIIYNILLSFKLIKYLLNKSLDSNLFLK